MSHSKPGTCSWPRPLLALVGSLFLAGAGTSHEGAWEILEQDESESDAWVLFSRQSADSDFLEYRIVGLIDAPTHRAAEAARAIRVGAEYLPEGAERTILQQDPNTIISYTRFALPGFFSDRDVTLQTDFYRGADGRYGLRWHDVPAKGPRKPEGVIRMPRSIGTWEFTPSDGRQTLATGVMHSELGGNIPAWLVNRMAGDKLVTELQQLRAIATSNEQGAR